MRKIVWPLLILLLIASIVMFSSKEDGSYRRIIEEEIANRLNYLEFSDESPFNVFGMDFKAPEYFQIDPSYRVNARVERIEERAYMTIGTSDGEEQRYLKFAWLTFNLNGTSSKLLVLKPVGLGSANVFYLAFADVTSGSSTYGGGRYIDVTIGKSDKVVLDFNLAYNPYCAYAPDFSCPLPPRENILSLSIMAGEKDFIK
ncbi:MAG: hypothetical protein ACI8QD_000294 [Cyclobacteriaceae bacterium]|jgi:uncharacterized protein (DUF1684 family)